MATDYRQPGRRRAGKLSTGIDAIDRRLAGGFQTGAVVALVTPPAAQSHAIFEQLLRRRPTVYVTTLRSQPAIESSLGQFSGAEFAISVQEVGEAAAGNSNALQELTGSEIHTLNTEERDRLLDDVYGVVETIDSSVNVIVDPANPLERCQRRSAYQNLLKKLTTKMIETDSLCLFHCTEMDDVPQFRETTLTVADVVWELDVVTGRKDNLEIQTRIPKNRGGDAVLEKVTLVVQGGDVYADDSRNI